jgi:hypothetical protein
MGPRPDDVPDWVIDHKNRNKLDNTAKICAGSANPSTAGTVSQGPKTTEGSTSRFKGVSKKDKTGPQWRVGVNSRWLLSHRA